MGVETYSPAIAKVDDIAYSLEGYKWISILEKATNNEYTRAANGKWKHYVPTMFSVHSTNDESQVYLHSP
jgi:hypothetical protein